MVKSINRSKNDIFGIKVLGFLFHNRVFIQTLRVVILSLFIYAIYLGFIYRGKDNLFTPALFWGIFWSFFMVVSLPTLGRVFCGICPHGFLGRYITKIGLKKSMPKWMQNRYIGIFILVVGWWGVYYTFDGIFKTPFATSIVFLTLTIISIIIFFLYKDMSYCKFICPIGTLTRAYAKLSPTWLGTYKSTCMECRSFDCAKACSYGLKPFTFDKKNSMEDCTLCMECSFACEAVSFKIKKPSFSLFGKIRKEGAEVWAYILILASIPISMAFHHGINRSNVVDSMIWSKTAEIFKPYLPDSINIVGLFTFLYAIAFTILAAVIGIYIASKISKRSFKETLYDLGYSYAPLFIFASLGHALGGFFTRGYEKIVEGFGWGFGYNIDVEPIAHRGDAWISAFHLFKWVAVIWSAYILYKRIRRLDITKIRKIFTFISASSLIIFYLGVNEYRDYILDKYGHKTHKTHNSLSHKKDINEHRVN